MQTGRVGLPTNLALGQSSYAAWPPGSRVSITLPLGFATSGLSGLSNAGKPKHSFVIAVRKAKVAESRRRFGISKNMDTWDSSLLLALMYLSGVLWHLEEATGARSTALWSLVWPVALWLDSRDKRAEKH